VIRERASKVVSLAFSKLYYACVVNDSGDRTVSFIKDVYVYPINVNNETFGQIVLKRDKDTT